MEAIFAALIISCSNLIATPITSYDVTRKVECIQRVVKCYHAGAETVGIIKVEDGRAWVLKCSKEVHL